MSPYYEKGVLFSQDIPYVCSMKGATNFNFIVQPSDVQINYLDVILFDIISLDYNYDALWCNYDALIWKQHFYVAAGKDGANFNHFTLHYFTTGHLNIQWYILINY